MDTCTFGEHLTIEGSGGEFVFFNDRYLVEHCLLDLPPLLGMHPLIAPVVRWADANDHKDPGG
ncbi:hypothetical protein [Nitrospira sp. Ecomares 2.1]